MYSDCSSDCQRVCGNHVRDAVEVCTMRCRPGCKCPDNLWLVKDSSRCVEECPVEDKCEGDLVYTDCLGCNENICEDQDKSVSLFAPDWLQQSCDRCARGCACPAGQWRAHPTHSRCVRTEEECPKPNVCCKALTAECQACSLGVTEEQYCEKYPETRGCFPGCKRSCLIGDIMPTGWNDTNAGNLQCCQEDEECKRSGCQKRTVDCKANPTAEGCYPGCEREQQCGKDAKTLFCCDEGEKCTADRSRCSSGICERDPEAEGCWPGCAPHKTCLLGDIMPAGPNDQHAKNLQCCAHDEECQSIGGLRGGECKKVEKPPTCGGGPVVKPTDQFAKDYACDSSAKSVRGVFTVTNKVPDGISNEDIGAHCRTRCSNSGKDSSQPCTGFYVNVNADGSRACSYFSKCDISTECVDKLPERSSDVGLVCVRLGTSFQRPQSCEIDDKRSCTLPNISLPIENDTGQTSAPRATATVLRATRVPVGQGFAVARPPPNTANFPAGGPLGDGTCAVVSNDMHTEQSDGTVLISTPVPARGLSNPFCQSTNGAPPSTVPDCTTLAAIEAAWLAALNNLPNPSKERNALVGAVVRLAFHDAGEFDGRFPAESASFGSNNRPLSERYGADGCLTEAGDHAGLHGAFDEVNLILEPIWQNFCDKITRADFWVVVASFALFGADTTNRLRDHPQAFMPIQVGRADSCNCDAGQHLRDADGVLDTNTHRMPVATRGIDTIQRVFVDQMGMTLQQATALLGAHSLGGMSPANSGFGVELSQQPVQTPWVMNNEVLTNDYFLEMVDDRWDPFRPGAVADLNSFGTVLAGSPPNQQWHSEKTANPPGWTTKPVMLNADMALAFDTGVEGNPPPGIDFVTDPVSPIDWCGGGPGSQLCVNGAPCCADATVHNGVTRAKVDQFRDPINGLNAFLDAFNDAFITMMSVGYGGGNSTHFDKLGSLTTIFANGTCLNGSTLAPTPPPSPSPTPDTSGNTPSPTAAPDGCMECYNGMCPTGYMCEAKVPGKCHKKGAHMFSSFASSIPKDAELIESKQHLFEFIPRPSPTHGNGFCVKVPEECCPIVDKVCGCDGRTYLNDCFRQKNSTQKDHCGACKYQPKKCGGILGTAMCLKTEHCELDAGMCNSKSVQGECVKSPQSCTKEWMPVCDCRGKTHGNDCMRQKRGSQKHHDGQCNSKEMDPQKLGKPVPECLRDCLSGSSGSLVCNDCCRDRCHVELTDVITKKRRFARDVSVNGTKPVVNMDHVDAILDDICNFDTVGDFATVKSETFFDIAMTEASTLEDEVERLGTRLAEGKPMSCLLNQKGRRHLNHGNRV